ncbi:60S ribosomal protein L29 [Striga asiatica]|uniref:60S ribosomal protein L29 n=1 Tax=Striga asiatica TaxID=4170 RepID=A0A5A7PYQ8_STRAF|nr:60S ribosomal protein L29 [Striga asiatica]
MSKKKQSFKAHKNGVKKPKRHYHTSTKGMDPKFLRNQRYARKHNNKRLRDEVGSGNQILSQPEAVDDMQIAVEMQPESEAVREMQPIEMWPEPAAAGEMQPEPAASGEMHPEPEASGELQPEPEVGGGMQPVPYVGREMWPEPAAAGEMQPEPAASGEMQPEPEAAGELQPEPDVGGEMQPDPLAAGEMKPEPLAAGEMQPVPDVGGEMQPEAEANNENRKAERLYNFLMEQTCFICLTKFVDGVDLTVYPSCWVHVVCQKCSNAWENENLKSGSIDRYYTTCSICRDENVKGAAHFRLEKWWLREPVQYPSIRKGDVGSLMNLVGHSAPCCFRGFKLDDYVIMFSCGETVEAHFMHAWCFLTKILQVNGEGEGASLGRVPTRVECGECAQEFGGPDHWFGGLLIREAGDL